MAVFNGMFPILPGKVEAARAFASEAMGARRAGFEASQKRVGITRQTWSIQETPDGNAFAVVWFECPDVYEAFADIAQDTSEYAVWFRERVMEINGVDLTEPAPAAPEVILDWKA